MKKLCLFLVLFIPLLSCCPETLPQSSKIIELFEEDIGTNNEWKIINHNKYYELIAPGHHELCGEKIHLLFSKGRKKLTKSIEANGVNLESNCLRKSPLRYSGNELTRLKEYFLPIFRKIYDG